MKKIILLMLAVKLCCTSLYAEASEKRHYNSSLSVQIGVNGASQDSSSFGLQLLPPDISYSHELFDNDVWNISTSTFFDNIGVEIKDTNFSYRIGQRIDFGMELGKYTPYVTLGLGVIKYSHHLQTSPVYGAGLLKRIAERFLWVNEMNFQDVFYQKSHYTIANVSTGIIYAF